MTARHSGVLTYWNDTDNSGFGYINPPLLKARLSFAATSSCGQALKTRSSATPSLLKSGSSKMAPPAR